MKYAGWAIAVLVLIGGGLSLFLTNDYDTPQVTELREMRANPELKVALPEKAPVRLPDENSAQPKQEAPAVTLQQMALADKQEGEILEMAREYDSVRADPQKRQALRDEMEQSLATYSETILPIAMEKMASAQSPN
jgi:hypothetical protein